MIEVFQELTYLIVGLSLIGTAMLALTTVYSVLRPRPLLTGVCVGIFAFLVLHGFATRMGL